MAAIADAANVSQEGKLNVTGIFDTIFADQLPAMHPNLSLAFRIKLESHDQNKTHHIDVTLVDQDGKVLWGAGADIQVGAIPAGQFTHANQVVNLIGVQFKAFGRYRFRIKVKGRDEPYDSVFQVVPLPKQPPQQS